MFNTVKLNHTVWYSNTKKIVRLDATNYIPEPTGATLTLTGEEIPNIIKVHNVTKRIKRIGTFPLDYTSLYFNNDPSPVDTTPKLADLFEVSYNADKKCFDIVILPNEKLNNDGEIKLIIDYVIYDGTEDGYTEDVSRAQNTKHTLEVIIPFRSHYENAWDFQFRPNYTDKLDIRNGFSHSPKPSEEPVVYTAELIHRDITDEFATYGDVKSMIETLAPGNTLSDLEISQKISEYITLNLDDITNKILGNYNVWTQHLTFENRLSEYTILYNHTDNAYSPNALLHIPFTSLRETPSLEEDNLKPVTDKLYYSKSEVDKMIQQLRAELTAARSTTSEQPQQ